MVRLVSFQEVCRFVFVAFKVLVREIRFCMACFSGLGPSGTPLKPANYERVLGDEAATGIFLPMFAVGRSVWGPALPITLGHAGRFSRFWDARRILA